MLSWGTDRPLFTLGTRPSCPAPALRTRLVPPPGSPLASGHRDRASHLQPCKQLAVPSQDPRDPLVPTAVMVLASWSLLPRPPVTLKPLQASHGCGSPQRAHCRFTQSSSGDSPAGPTPPGAPWSQVEGSKEPGCTPSSGSWHPHCTGGARIQAAELSLTTSLSHWALGMQAVNSLRQSHTYENMRVHTHTHTLR